MNEATIIAVVAVYMAGWYGSWIAFEDAPYRLVRFVLSCVWPMAVVARLVVLALAH